MVKKLLVMMSVVLGMLGVSAGLAPSASAAIGDCSAEKQVTTGTKLTSCIYVDNSNGRARATLTFTSSATFAVYDVYVTIQRSGSSATAYCQIAFFPSDGLQPRICNAYAGNPAGRQAWRADSTANGVPASSPTVYEG